MPILRRKKQASLEACSNAPVYMANEDIRAYKRALEERGYCFSEGTRELILDWMDKNKVGRQRGNKRRRTYNRQKIVARKRS